jgi:hypothetical protein
MPRGGSRIGCGRKPLNAVQRALTGNAGHRSRVLLGPGAGEALVTAAIDPFEPTVELASDERRVWDALAPHAFAARTLTRGTELAFALLCRNLVIERAQARMAPGTPSHRGMIQRVDAELAAFSLRPFGKPILTAEPVVTPANPLERFLHRTRA